MACCSWPAAHGLLSLLSYTPGPAAQRWPHPHQENTQLLASQYGRGIFNGVPSSTMRLWLCQGHVRVASTEGVHRVGVFCSANSASVRSGMATDCAGGAQPRPGQTLPPTATSFCLLPGGTMTDLSFHQRRTTRFLWGRWGKDKLASAKNPTEESHPKGRCGTHPERPCLELTGGIFSINFW